MDGYVLLLNPDPSLAILPDLLKQMGIQSKIRRHSLPSRTDYTASDLIVAGGRLIGYDPEAAGVIYGPNYMHHLDLAFGKRFADRLPEGKKVLLFTDQHYDDIQYLRGKKRTLVPKDFPDCGWFVPQLCGAAGIDAVYFAAQESADEPRRQGGYCGSVKQFSVPDILVGRRPEIPEDAGVISLTDIDAVRRHEAVFGYSAAARDGRPTARQLAKWQAAALAGRRNLGFTVCGHFEEDRWDEETTGRYYIAKKNFRTAAGRAPYTIAQLVAANLGKGEHIDAIADEADRLFPAPK